MKSLKMRYGFYLLTRGPIATRDGILSLAPNITLFAREVLPRLRELNPTSVRAEVAAAQ